MVDKGRGVAKNDGDILKAGQVEPLRNFNTQGQEKAFGDKEWGEGADVCKNAQGQRNAIGAKERTDSVADKGGGVADKCGDILKLGEVELLSNFKAQGREKAFGDKKWGGGKCMQEHTGTKERNGSKEGN